MSDKEKIKLLSGNFSHVYASHVPSMPSGSLYSNIQSFDDFLNENIAKCHYLPNGNGVEGMPRLFPCDIDFDSLAASTLHRVFETIMTDTDLFTVSQESLSEAARSLNAPYVTGIKANGPELFNNKDVMILCAGDGEDLNRIGHSAATSANSIYLVEAGDLNPRACGSGTTKIISDPRKLHHIPPGELGEYDTILCHHGLGHVLSTEEGVEAFKELISSHLRPNGRVLGDKLDFVGLRGMVLPSTEAGRTVALEYYDPGGGCIEGVMHVSVGPKVWRDPVLSDRRLHNLAEEMGVDLLAANGRGIFTIATLGGQPMVPPPSLARASERSEVRAMTYVEMRKRDGIPRIAMHPSPNDSGGVMEWREQDPPDHVRAQLSFRVVKGVLVGTKDVWNLSVANSLFAEKQNGVCGRVVIGSGSAWMAVEGAKGYRFFNSTTCARSDGEILKLQVEVMDLDVSPRAIVVDPVHMGSMQPPQFAARVNLYNDFLRKNPRYRSILPQQDWKEKWEDVASVCQEGVVIMNMMCPPPYTPSLARACHYVKRVVTIDIEEPDGSIGEYVYERGKGPVPGRVRVRSDKRHPNSPETIRAIDASLPFSSVDMIYRSLLSEDPPLPIAEMVAQAIKNIDAIIAGDNDATLTIIPVWLLIHKSRKCVPPALEKKIEEYAKHAGMRLGDPYRQLDLPAPQIHGVFSRVSRFAQLNGTHGEATNSDDVFVPLPSVPHLVAIEKLLAQPHVAFEFWKTPPAAPAVCLFPEGEFPTHGCVPLTNRFEPLPDSAPARLSNMIAYCWSTPREDWQMSTIRHFHTGNTIALVWETGKYSLLEALLADFLKANSL